MSEVENREVAERLFEAIRNRDVELFHQQFCPDSVLELPQSGERIVGEERRRQVYQTFPGRPTVTRILTGGEVAVVEADVDYGDGVDWCAVFICEFAGGQIKRLTAYWMMPFESTHSQQQSTEATQP